MLVALLLKIDLAFDTINFEHPDTFLVVMIKYGNLGHWFGI